MIIEAPEVLNSLSKKMSRASKRTQAGKPLTSPYALQKQIKENEFLIQLENILLLTVGAQIREQDDGMDSQYLQAWYRHRSHYARLAAGSSLFVKFEFKQAYCFAPTNIFRACLLSEPDLSADEKTSRFDRFLKEYQGFAPNLAAYNAWLGLPLSSDRETDTEGFTSDQLHDLHQWIQDLLPTSSANFMRIFQEIRQTYPSELHTSNPLLRCTGAGHSILGILALGLIAFIYNAETLNMKLVATGIALLLVLSTSMGLGYFISHALDKMKTGIFNNLRLTDLTPTPVAQPQKTQSASTARAPLQKPLPNIQLIAVEAPGHQVGLAQADNGVVYRTITATITTPIRAAPRPKQLPKPPTTASMAALPFREAAESTAAPKSFGFMLDGTTYIFPHSLELVGEPTLIVRNTFGEPFYCTIKPGINTPEDALSILSQQNLNLQMEQGFFSIRPFGNTRYYAVKIETGAKHLPLYLVIHYEENAHKGDGGLHRRNLTTTEHNKPSTTTVTLFDDARLRQYLRAPAVIAHDRSAYGGRIQKGVGYIASAM